MSGSAYAPSLGVTFPMPPPLAWQWPSSPVQSVNEVEEPSGMVGTVWLEERLSVLLITQEVGCVVVVGDIIVCLQAVLYYWHCQSKFLGGTGWWCCGRGLSPPFQSSFQSIECTLPATPWLVIFYLMDAVDRVICAHVLPLESHWSWRLLVTNFTRINVP